MAHHFEVWLYRDSPTAAIAVALGNRYVIRELPGSAQSDSSQAAVSQANGLHVVCLADMETDDLATLGKLAREQADARLIALVGAAESKAIAGANGWPARQIFAYLPRQAPPEMLRRSVAAAFENMELAERERGTREELARTHREMQELNRIGIALSSEHDVERLLSLILQKVREITAADAGSLYLVEETREGERHLRFKLTQNDSRRFPFTEYSLPITEGSVAGYVALHGEPIGLADARAIAKDRPYQFNAHYDQESGYRTGSVLALPMKTSPGEVLGVLQLINCKRDRAALLDSPEDFAREVQPFPERAVQLAMSVASQAAVAYENSQLYKGIATLFEGFVNAAVTAIEQRDPTTSGHSLRVAYLTVGLAETVDRATNGRYAGVRIDRAQMKELRYAALLHDFGKVGVREEVLVKAKKLYPAQLELIQQRFDYARKELEARINRQKMQCLLERSREEAQAEILRLEGEYRRRLEEIDDDYRAIVQLNEPSLLSGGDFGRVLEIARQTFTDPRGVEFHLLRPDEIRSLSVPKGSLDDDERAQIQSHVIHTFNFLRKIPWTKEFRDIPQIARAHHEKLDGSGYPYKLKGDEIPLQAKMMTICDIFDALTASDRPYKKAVPVQRALDILKEEVRDKALDAELFQLFLEAELYRLTIQPG